MDTSSPDICPSDKFTIGGKKGVYRSFLGNQYLFWAKRRMYYRMVDGKQIFLHRDLYFARNPTACQQWEVVCLGDWEDFTSANWFSRPRGSGQSTRNRRRKHAFIDFNGRRYSREPTGYYCDQQNRKRLHRAVWEYHRGEIPDGYDVHHKDENKDNNDISNFELLTRSRHMRLHGATNPWIVGGGAASALRNPSVQRKAAAWHASPEGIEWHRQNGKRVMAKQSLVERLCQCCGKSYLTKRPTFSKFCSTRCKQRKSRHCSDSSSATAPAL